MPSETREDKQRRYSREYQRRRRADPAFDLVAFNARQRAYRFGITVERLREIIAVGRCAICGTTAPGGRHDEWHIDHDHVTGEIREALCNDCNLGVGMFDDDPEKLRAAADYLDRHSLAGLLL